MKTDGWSHAGGDESGCDKPVECLVGVSGWDDGWAGTSYPAVIPSEENTFLKLKAG